MANGVNNPTSFPGSLLTYEKRKEPGNKDVHKPGQVKSIIVAVTVFSWDTYESNSKYCTLEEKRNFVPARNRAESLHEANRFHVS